MFILCFQTSRKDWRTSKHVVNSGFTDLSSIFFYLGGGGTLSPTIICFTEQSYCHIKGFHWSFAAFTGRGMNRPEVRKLLLFYFYFFLTWSWKIIPYLRFYFFLTWRWKIIPYLLFYFFSTWSWKIIPYICFYFFSTWIWEIIPYFGGLVQDCSNPIANSLELLQSCTKPPKYGIISQIKVEKK